MIEPATVLPRQRRGRISPLWWGTAAVLALCLLVRLPYIPRLGNGFDAEEYRAWTAAIQDHGVSEVFDQTDTDYVGYHYLLWAVGKGFGRSAGAATIRDKELRVWLKLPGIVGDLLSTILVIAFTADLCRRCGIQSPARLRPVAERLSLHDHEVLALGAGLLWGLNPALMYMGVYWGQNDSLTTAFALAAIWAALRGRPALAALLLVLGATLKPQPIVLAPVLGLIVLQRSGWRGAVRAAAAGTATLIAGHLYFFVTGHGDDVIRIYRTAAITPELLTFSAYNLWWPFAAHSAPGAADTVAHVGTLAIRWGTLSAIAVLGVLGVTLAAVWRDRQDTTALMSAAYFSFGFFMVGSGVHERYALPALAFLIPAMVVTGQRAWAAPVLTATLTINALMGLPLDRAYTQGKPEWLTIAVSLVNIALFGWWSWHVARGAGSEWSGFAVTAPDSTRASARQ